MPNAAKIFGGSSDKRRGNSAKRGYDAGHRGRRKECLAAAEYICQCPGCPECAPAGEKCEQLATVADHIIPHRGDKRLLEDPENLRAICARCHMHKTLREGK